MPINDGGGGPRGPPPPLCYSWEEFPQPPSPVASAELVESLVCDCVIVSDAVLLDVAAPVVMLFVAADVLLPLLVLLAGGLATRAASRVSRAGGRSRRRRRPLPADAAGVLAEAEESPPLASASLSCEALLPWSVMLPARLPPLLLYAPWLTVTIAAATWTTAWLASACAPVGVLDAAVAPPAEDADVAAPPVAVAVLDDVLSWVWLTAPVRLLVAEPHQP